MLDTLASHVSAQLGSPYYECGGILDPNSIQLGNPLGAAGVPAQSREALRQCSERMALGDPGRNMRGYLINIGILIAASLDESQPSYRCPTQNPISIWND